jgi:prolipoprotein diacylglyceryltransferase
MIWRRLAFGGALFLLVVAGYATGRLALESARDLPAESRGFTVHHVISLLIIVLSVAAITGRGLT